jgi:hypothetical protein
MICAVDHGGRLVYLNGRAAEPLVALAPPAPAPPDGCCGMCCPSAGRRIRAPLAPRRCSSTLAGALVRIARPPGAVRHDAAISDISDRIADNRRAPTAATGRWWRWPPAGWAMALDVRSGRCTLAPARPIFGLTQTALSAETLLERRIADCDMVSRNAQGLRATRT